MLAIKMLYYAHTPQLLIQSRAEFDLFYPFRRGMSRDVIIKACHDVVLHYWRTPNRVNTPYYDQFYVLACLPDSYKRNYELTELVARESRGKPPTLTNAELFDEIAL